MKRKQKNGGRAMSVGGGLAISGMVMLILTIILSALLAVAVEKGTIPVEKIGYWIMALLIAVPFLGSELAAGKIQHRKKEMCLLAGAIYLLILFSITALFFGGQYEAVWETVLLVSVGTGIAFLLQKNGGPRPGKGRRRIA